VITPSFPQGYANHIGLEVPESDLAASAPCVFDAFGCFARRTAPNFRSDGIRFVTGGVFSFDESNFWRAMWDSEMAVDFAVAHRHFDRVHVEDVRELMHSFALSGDKRLLPAPLHWVTDSLVRSIDIVVAIDIVLHSRVQHALQSLLGHFLPLTFC